MEPISPRRGIQSRLLLVAAAGLFSTGGAGIKAVTMSGWQIACFRSAIAAVVLLIALPGARRGWRWRMVPVAACYAATLILFSLANRLTTAANAVFLQATAPLYVLLLGPLLLREPIRRADVVYIAIIIGGMLLIFRGAQSIAVTAPDPALGNTLALTSGVTYALTVAGFRWLAKQPGENPGIVTAALGNLLSALAALPLIFPMAAVSRTNLAILIYLGGVQVGLAYICLTRGLRDVRAVEATTLLMLEPALNPVWSWLAHGERPGAPALAGGAMILAATLANSWNARR